MNSTNELATTPTDMFKLNDIMDRVASDLPILSHAVDRWQIELDIECVHHIIALDLDRLLISSLSDFAHDVLGIYKNFDRIQFELVNHFVPRSVLH